MRFGARRVWEAGPLRNVLVGSLQWRHPHVRRLRSADLLEAWRDVRRYSGQLRGRASLRDVCLAARVRRYQAQVHAMRTEELCRPRHLLRPGVERMRWNAGLRSVPSTRMRVPGVRLRLPHKCLRRHVHQLWRVLSRQDLRRKQVRVLHAQRDVVPVVRRRMRDRVGWLQERVVRHLRRGRGLRWKPEVRTVRASDLHRCSSGMWTAAERVRRHRGLRRMSARQRVRRQLPLRGMPARNDLPQQRMRTAVRRLWWNAGLWDMCRRRGVLRIALLQAADLRGAGQDLRCGKRRVRASSGLRDMCNGTSVHEQWYLLHQGPVSGRAEGMATRRVRRDDVLLVTGCSWRGGDSSSLPRTRRPTARARRLEAGSGRLAGRRPWRPDAAGVQRKSRLRHPAKAAQRPATRQRPRACVA